MRSNYVKYRVVYDKPKYRVVYDKPKYLCSNRKLTDDIEKSRVFSSASAAYDSARIDIVSGIAQVYAYGRGRSRSLVVFGD